MSATVQVSEADVEALESAGDSLMRAHAVDSALAMYALVLRLRAALNGFDESAYRRANEQRRENAARHDDAIRKEGFRGRDPQRGDWR